MNIKCSMGLHKWSDWYTFRSTKRQERYCEVCQLTEYRELPPLKFQIEEILKMDISREEMNRKLDNLSDWYGYQKFTVCILALARQRFRVPNREPRYETRERLVFFYLKESEPLTSIKEYARLSLSRLIK